MTIQTSCDQKCIGFALVLAAPTMAAGLHWRLESDGSCFRFKKNENPQKVDWLLGSREINQSKKGLNSGILNVKKGETIFYK
jgi:hypothetical protein